MGGLPKLLDFFQDKGDKKHELAMAAMQMERELKMLEAGYVAQARVEEIRTEQVAMETQAQERTAMYQPMTSRLAKALASGLLISVPLYAQW
jgi:hypothetical protein